MRDFLRDIPSYWPLIIVWTVVGLVVARPSARFLRTWPAITFGLFMCVGLILLATLSPNDPPRPWELSGACDLSRVGPPSLQTLVTDRDALRNVVLFLPLGFLLGLLPRSGRAFVVIIAAFGLTFFVETGQLVLEDLGRGCESADMIDNTIGLAVGLVLGAAVSLGYSRYLGSDAQDAG